MNKISNEVISIAVLNSKILGEDLLEAYIPFISTLISKKQYEKIDIQQICEDFSKEYPFKIPAMPMTEILTRMVKLKILNKDKGGKIIPNYEKITETDFNEVSTDNLIKYENIKNKYIEYAEKNYSFKIEEKKAEENFSNFIKENYLETIVNDEYIKNVDNRLENGEVKNDIYILYKFIIHLYRNEYELFKIIKNLCLGYTIANALSLDNISSNRKNFKEKKIFFDTKFILRLLGIEGEFYQKTYNSIVSILKENECSLHVFSHTYNEILEILKNAKDRIKQNRLNEEYISDVQRYFMKEKFSEGTIKLFIATLQKKLNELEIYIDDRGYSKITDQYQISQEELYDQIISVYKNNNQNFDEETKKETIYRDIKSMELIYREMRGIRSLSIETAKVFFVTTNKSLAYACKNFDKTIAKKEGIAPCITDIFLGTILWFQNPIRYDNLKETQILANCYAAVTPNSTMINKFSKEVEKLKEEKQITAEDVRLLKNYEITTSMLSDKVMGNVDNINEDVTYEVLADIKESIQKPLKQELEEEKIKSKKLEEEKSKTEEKSQKYEEILRNQAKRKAKIKSTFFIILFIIIPIAVALLDLYFNIFDVISQNKGVAVIIRCIIYIFLTTPAVISIIARRKKVPEIEKKEYEKMCKKNGVNIDEK